MIWNSASTGGRGKSHAKIVSGSSNFASSATHQHHQHVTDTRQRHVAAFGSPHLRLDRRERSRSPRVGQDAGENELPVDSFSFRGCSVQDSPAIEAMLKLYRAYQGHLIKVKAEDEPAEDHTHDVQVPTPSAELPPATPLQRMLLQKLAQGAGRFDPA